MTDSGRRRPWLAALLAVAVSGLGHAYLRRWARALAWYAAVTATVVLFVPDSALDGALAGDPPPLADVAPAVAVVAASVIDAYVLAARTNPDGEGRGAAEGDAPDTAGTEGSRTEAAAVPSCGSTDGDRDGSDAGDAAVACPECGRDVNSEFDFCQWCAAPLGAGADD